MDNKEKIIALILMGVITVITILMLFSSIDPKPIPEQNNTDLEIKVENQKLKNLVDSLSFVDSIHLIQLKEKQVIIKYRKNEITKVINFIPNADSKYKDSLWSVYLQDTLWRDSLK